MSVLVPRPFSSLVLCLCALGAGTTLFLGCQESSAGAAGNSPGGTTGAGGLATTPPADNSNLDPAADEDGDGLTNGTEFAGWTVTIEKPSGPAETRTVTSDPRKVDTNDDGIGDAEAAEKLLDPAALGGDTDGDGLSDLDELRIWRSKPTSVDSDGDSGGNPALFDGPEARAGTSPTMADTDGDGINDFKEQIEMAQFDPRIADTPRLEVELIGKTQLVANFQSSSSQDDGGSTTVELENSTSSESAVSDSSSHEVSAEVGVKASVEAEAGFPSGASVKASAEVSASAGYAYTTSSGTTDTSGEASREAYAEVVSRTHTEGVTQLPGTLAVFVRLRNTGVVSFELRNLVINALQRDREDPARFTTIASLTAVGDTGTAGGDFASLSLAPNGAAERRFSTDKLSPNLTLELLAEPERLFFEVGSVDLFRQAPELSRDIDFAFLEQETNARTAFVQIDYGNGNAIRRRIATNVRATDGQISGIPLAVALSDVLGIGFETQKRVATDGSEGPTVLTSVDEYTEASGRLQNEGGKIAVDREANAFWVVVGANGMAVDSSADFEDILLRGGDVAYLMYVRDTDKDGLFAHEEFLYGTYDSAAAAAASNVADPTDSDGDGIDDATEVKVGWRVGRQNLALVSPYDKNARVFSDPSRIDGDHDGKTDAEERTMATDPNNPDTDGDGYADGPGSGGSRASEGEDPDPLDPSLTGNKPPTLESLAHSLAGLRVTLNVVATDADANLRRMTIDWGDSSPLQTETGGLNGNRPQPSVTHDYAKMGTYTVAVEVFDKLDKMSRKTYVLEITLPSGGLVGEWLFDVDSLSKEKLANSALEAPNAEQLSKPEFRNQTWSNLDASANGTFSDDGEGYCAMTTKDRFGNRDAALLINTSSTPGSGDPNSRAEIRIPGRRSFERTPGSKKWVHAPRLPLNDAFTVAIWIRPDRHGANGLIWGQQEVKSKDSWVRLQRGRLMDGHGQTESGKVSLVLPGQTAPDLVATDPNVAADDAWTFYVATVIRSGTQSTAVLYRNGAEVVRASGSGDYGNPVLDGSSDARLFVGGFDQGNFAFEGTIDDLRIYNRVLSPSEIQLLYNENGWPQ